MAAIACAADDFWSRSAPASWASTAWSAPWAASAWTCFRAPGSVRITSVRRRTMKDTVLPTRRSRRNVVIDAWSTCMRIWDWMRRSQQSGLCVSSLTMDTQWRMICCGGPWRRVIARVASAAPPPEPQVRLPSSGRGALDAFVEPRLESSSPPTSSAPSTDSDARPKRAGRSTKTALATTSSRPSSSMRWWFAGSDARLSSHLKIFASVSRGMCCVFSFRSSTSDTLLRTSGCRTAGTDASAQKKSTSDISTASSLSRNSRRSMSRPSVTTWLSKSISRRSIVRAIVDTTAAAMRRMSSFLFWIRAKRWRRPPLPTTVAFAARDWHRFWSTDRLCRFTDL